MVPSPSKGKGVHKSSGKLFRKKDHDSSKSSSSNTPSSHSNNGSGSGSSSRKDDSNSGSSSASVDLKDCAITLPVMHAIDHIKCLPRYNNLANSNLAPVCNGEAISMEELDNLQLELELLASSMMVRQSALGGQVAVLEQMEKGKITPRVASPIKRVRSDGDKSSERPNKKARDGNGKARELGPPPPSHSSAHHPVPPPPSSKIPKLSNDNNSRVKCSIVKNEPMFDVPDQPSAEAPRPPPPRNDITNRFWAMVDTYCQEMTAEDIKLLEDLIAAHNDDPDAYKIQPLGKHYTLRWAQEDLMDEQKEGSKLSDSNNGSKKKGNSEVPDKLLKEVDLNNGGGSADDAAPLGPLAQRLLAGLLEEKVVLQGGENKGAGVGRPGFLRSLGLGSGASLEKRLKKELQDQGIMEPDHPGMPEEDDEILCELKRCQSELRSVSSHNHAQLSRLLKLARDALYRHDLKKKLRDAEAKVIEAHKNIASLRIKKKPPSKKDKEAAWKAIKDREAIVRQLDSITSN